jgi:hypothetical protein
MPVLQHSHAAEHAPSFSGNKIHTTLYNVIQAVSQAIEPGEEEYISTVVMQLLGDYNARPESDFRNGPVQTRGRTRRLYLYRGGQT